MVVIGLFNWLPMLWLGSHGHQFVVEDKGQSVEWVIHDHSKDYASDHVAHAVNHTLTVPCDDEGKSGLNAELDKLPIISLSLWIWFAIWCLSLTRLHHRIPLLLFVVTRCLFSGGRWSCVINASETTNEYLCDFLYL